MPKAVPHQHLLDRRATLKAKLASLQSGDLNSEQSKDDGRQDEAIARTEKFLREIAVEITAAEKEPAKDAADTATAQKKK